MINRNREYEAFNVEVFGQGKPIILIPEVSPSASIWKQTVEHFSKIPEERYFRVYSFK
ncbi:hypothetical protein AB6T38_19145 [Aliiglaciecola sp. SL4]|uniref:hypothetical protein n=1 Tax=Aliiglaciecola sp. SL4 TaxID=3239806 RepID=UPI00355C80DE